MKPIVLRIRPAEIMEDLDLDVVRERATRLADWATDVQDTRLFDAPYVSVVVTMPAINFETAARLKAAFADLPRMRANVWQRIGAEVPLAAADLAVLEEASQSRNRAVGTDSHGR